MDTFSSRCRRLAVSRIVLSFAAACVVGLAGCRTHHAVQGAQRPILATYRARTLRADLPMAVRVPAVVAAADAALRDAGYAVTGSWATEDSGTVEGKPADAGLLESVWVSARVVAEGTRVAVRIEPFGDESRSRAILDGILARLGL